MISSCAEKIIYVLTCLLRFRRGYQWTYKGRETAASISDYIDKGHLSDKYKTVAKPLDWL